jgi:antitoxin MazE
METKLVKIGNSFGVIIPAQLIQQYKLSNTIQINPTEKGILISAKKKARDGWREQLGEAILQENVNDNELLEGFEDEVTVKEWQW